MAAFPLRVALLWVLLFIALLMGNVYGRAIIIPPKSFTGIIGKTASFQCKVEFPGANTVMSWEFNKNPVYSYQYGREDYPMRNKKYLVTKEETTFTLTVLDLEYADAGTYTCRVVEMEQTAVLLILGMPELVTSKANTVEGSTAGYICTARFGGPEKDDISLDQFPQLRMLLNGTELSGIVTEQPPEGARSYYTSTQTIDITLEARMHGSVLMCTVGTSSPQVWVNVTTEITVLYSARNIEYKPHNDWYHVGTTISCTAEGNPKPYYVWNETKTGNIVHGHSLTITEEMEGSNTWRCTARNTLNEQLHSKSIDADFDVVLPGMQQIKSEPESGSGHWKTGVGIIIPVCLVIGCVAALFYHRRRKRRHEANGIQDNDEGASKKRLLDKNNETPRRPHHRRYCSSYDPSSSDYQARKTSSKLLFRRRTQMMMHAHIFTNF